MKHTVWMMVVLGVLATIFGGLARADDDDAPSPAQVIKDVDNRLPQPVRVGDLVGREVLEPVATRNYLGRVRELIRAENKVEVVVEYGGWFGIGARPIAVPIDAMTLLGSAMEIVAYSPEQLRDFPTFDPAGAKVIEADAKIDVGLSKPPH